jgi:hypothetical protein
MSLLLDANTIFTYPRAARSKRRTLRGLSLAAYIFAAAVVFFAIALAAFLSSLPTRSTAAQHTPAVAPVVAAASGGSPSLEVHIANNGLVLLRSARVVSINGTALTVSTNWGPTNFSWVVNTSARSYETRHFGTNFLDRSGNSLSLQDLQPGDLVTVTGMLENNHQLALDADTVRSLK